MSRLHIARTFTGRVTCALAITLAVVSLLVTDDPGLLDAGALRVLLGTAVAVFGVAYLSVCSAELLLGALRS